MKDLPEEELFDQLGNRLRNYHEEPDEHLWEKIAVSAGATQQQDWLRYADHGLALLSSTLLFLLLYLAVPVYKSSKNEIINPELANTVEPALTDAITIPDNQSAQLFLSNQEAPALIEKKQSRKAFYENGEKSITIIDLNTDRLQHNSLQELMQNTERPQEQATKENQVTFANNKKTDSIILTSAFVKDSVAQSSKEEKKRKKNDGLRMYVSLTPNLVYNKITPLANDGIVISGIRPTAALSTERLGVGAEVGMESSITKKLSYYVGANYYKQQTVSSYRYVAEGNTSVEQVGNSLTFEIRPMSNNHNSQQTSSSVGANAGVLYQLKAGALAQKVGAGLMYQYSFIKQQSDQSIEVSQSGNVYYQLLYRSEYALRNGWSVFAQPNFTYALLERKQSNNPFTTRPYWVGVSLGITFRVMDKPE
jgi:hypothetical protein